MLIRWCEAHSVSTGSHSKLISTDVNDNNCRYERHLNACVPVTVKEERFRSRITGPAGCRFNSGGNTLRLAHLSSARCFQHHCLYTQSEFSAVALEPTPKVGCRGHLG
jgi:hypothetical protein